MSDATGYLTDDEVDQLDAPATELARVEHLAPLPIVPPGDEMRALVQLAVTLSASAMVPKALRDHPNDTLLVLLTARDLGIKVTTALRLCHPIEGVVTIAPKLKLAIVRERGTARVWPDADNDHVSATWYAVRRDDPETVYTMTYTWRDAQFAGLVDAGCEPDAHSPGCIRGQADYKNRAPKCKSNWYGYPGRMLTWRAVGYLLDEACGEVGTGLYSPDELGAVTDDDGNPVLDVMEVGPLAGTSAPGDRAGRPAPAAPEDVPADDDTRAELQAILDSLPAAARELVKPLWVESIGYRVSALPASKAPVARALLASFVKRAGAGEWGDWPADASTPADAPPAPDAPDDAPDAADGDLGGNEGLVVPPPFDDLDHVIAWVNELPPATVRAYLDAEGRDTLAVDGTDVTCARFLAETLAVRAGFLGAF